MKGFGIYVKNDLLDPKHVLAMGKSVWLYLWLIDHMTSIGEDGVGKVLGGRPVKYEEIVAELGITSGVYTEWIQKLEDYPYVKTTRTPYGIVFKVFKAEKRFGKQSIEIQAFPKEIQAKAGIHRFRQNPESNKTLHYNTKDKDALTRFELFWKEYPKRKRDRDLCMKKFISFEEEIQKKIVSDVIERKAKHTDWIKENFRFVCAPIVYLRGKRWEEEIDSTGLQKISNVHHNTNTGGKTAVEKIKDKMKKENEKI